MPSASASRRRARVGRPLSRSARPGGLAPRRAHCLPRGAAAESPRVQELPEWKEGTVAVLSTGGGAPHAIPVSAAVRAGPRRVLIALAVGRESLARLRREPRCALTII